MSSPLYRYIPCSYLYSYPVANLVFRDIFLSFIGFLPSLILKFWLLGVFVLFRLSHKAWLHLNCYLFHGNNLQRFLPSSGCLGWPCAIPSVLIIYWAFPWAYVYGPIHSIGPNWHLGFRPEGGDSSTPHNINRQSREKIQLNSKFESNFVPRVSSNF